MVSAPSIGIIKLLLLLPGMAYLGLALFAAVFANRLVFPAPPAGYKDSPDIIKFSYDDLGRSVSMVFLKHPRSPYLIFYHHGNGEDLQGVLSQLRYLRDAGFSVLAWDYPGYGTSDGKPSEKLILTIAEKIWKRIPADYGFPAQKVFLYGYSLGSGPAVWLANRYQPAGLILEGAFSSIFRVSMGVNILPWDIFNNLGRIKGIQCPLLIFHGTEDATIPFAHATQLFALAPDPKSFTWIDGGEHGSLTTTFAETYNSSLERFTSQVDQSN